MRRSWYRSTAHASRAQHTLGSVTDADRTALDRAREHLEAGGAIVLFDGECAMCDTYARFVLDRDPFDHFRLASLRSEIGRAVARVYGAGQPDFSTIVLIERDGVHVRSTAVLRTTRKLRGAWSLTGALLLIPRIARDLAYDVIARSRLRWHGRADTCVLLTPRLRARLLD